MEKNYYKEYAILEKSHWWFRARLKILEKVINDTLPDKDAKPEILNAGVASGITSLMLEKFGNVSSLEYDEDCCEYLRNTAGIEVTHGSLTELPYQDNSFDMVCAFDVIEHIEDDELAVREIQRVLKPNGHAFLTVPAYQFLWTDHDEINHHFRRYTMKNLSKTISGKLKIKYISYFNSILFIPIATARIIGNFLSVFKKNKEIKSDFEAYKANSFINKILYTIFLSESNLIGKLRLPFGVSLIAVCSKVE